MVFNEKRDELWRLAREFDKKRLGEEALNAL